MTDQPSDRNLLVGILALQLNFISRDQLIAAMHIWVVEKSQRLEDILVEQQVIEDSTRDLLLALIDKHLQLHSDDVHQSLAALSSVESNVQDQLMSLGDSDISAGLARMTMLQVGAPGGAEAEPTHIFDSSGLSDDGVRFRVLRPHARGGLGQVSVALDKEFNREVALKEIQERHANDEQSRIRFLLEAEVTGGLEHPGIVPVYGLGSYADGRPFYAMRFVRGNTFQEAVQRFHSTQEHAGSQIFHSSDFRKLLGRFLDICNAIEYAHCRGVLHRDLKPGNIMLGRYGETMVVDWGLSKILDAESVQTIGEEPALQVSSDSQSAATQMGSAIGTPAYMSPEQAGGRFDMLGPASDIYSLGATLYFLLTARAPLVDEDLPTILRKTQGGEFPNPREINPNIPSSLEAICRKSMALEPKDRYPSVEALAEDIEHWLADEPTVAMPDGIAAKVGRWLRKHRAAAATGLAASMIIAVVSIATAIVVETYRKETSRQYSVAQEQRARAMELAETNKSLAETEASAREAAETAREAAETERELAETARKVAETRRIESELSQYVAEVAQKEAESKTKEAEAITDFIVSTLRSPDPSKKGEQVTVAQVLDAAVNTLEESFPDRPLTQAYLLTTIGTTYRGLAKYDEGAQAFRMAREIYRNKKGEKHGDTLRAANSLAMCLSTMPRQEDKDEAHRMFESTYDARREVFGMDHFDTTSSMINLATSFQSRKEYDRAVELFEQALEIRKRTLGPKHVDTLVSMNNLALCYNYLGENETALRLFKETLELKEEVLGRTHYSTVISIHNYGYQLDQAGRTEEAIPLLEEALTLRTARYGAVHPSRLTTLRVLGLAHKKLEHYEQAINLLRELTEARETTLGQSHPSTIQALDDLARILSDSGDKQGAAELLDESLNRHREEFGEQTPETLQRMNGIGQTYFQIGDLERARVMLETALDEQVKLLGDNHTNTRNTRLNLAKLRQKQGNFDSAINLFAENVTILRD